MVVEEKQRERVESRAEAGFDELYAQLNPGQKEAVDTIEGPVMVLAGPGTGKTQTLTMRIAKILRETQMDPWNILCLTFTESAVTAMRERLVSIIGTPAYYVRIHTFHSFCNDVIQEHPEVFALARDWQVLTDIERVQLFQDIIDGLPGTSALKPFGAPYLFLKDIASNIQDLKQEDISPEQFGKISESIAGFLEATGEQVQAVHVLKPKERTEAVCEKLYADLKAAGIAANLPNPLLAGFKQFYEKYEMTLQQAEGKRDISKACTALKNDIKHWHDRMGRQLPKWRELKNVYGQYKTLLAERGRYDYEDMILMVVDQFKRDPNLLAEYQEQFQYMLVDEYQDTNGAQNEVVQLLAVGGLADTHVSPNIFVVGDDKQSIYRFQGASLNNMLEFYEQYQQEAAIISLSDNYRSQPTVLSAAAAVVSHNEESLAKYVPGVTDMLEPRSGRVAMPVELHTLESEEEEDYAAAQQIKHWLSEGVEPHEIAVLFRYNRDGEQLTRFLRSEGIPVRLEGGENVLEDVTVQQLLTLLRYVAGRTSSESGGDDAALAEIIQYAWWSVDEVAALKAIHRAGIERRPLLSILEEEKEFVPIVKLLAHWRKRAANVTLQHLLHEILNDSGLLPFVLEQDSHLATLQKLSSLMNEAKQVARANAQVSLRQFLMMIEALEEHGMALTVEPWHVADGAVRLMTAHKAKGLEFERVIITRMNDKHWGNVRSANKVSLPHGLVRFDMILAQENNEDERRLFYVAMTRAKQQIMLMRSRHSSTGRQTVPSIFLHEVPAEALAAYEHEEDESEVARRLVDSFRPLPEDGDEEVREWVSRLLQDYVMSVTHLNNYLECPYKFYVKNILRFPTVKTPPQALGTAVHAALQDFFMRYNESGKRPSKAFLLEKFARSLSREALTKVEYEDTIVVGNEQLGAYFDRYKDEFPRHTLLEYNFSSHGVTVAGVALTGKIDKIEPTGGELAKGATVNVVDYKTGNPERGARKLKEGEDYWRQLVFYQLLCDESPRFPYTMVSGEVDFIKPNKKGQYVKKRLAISGEEVAELKETIGQVWNEMKELRFLEADGRCGECEVCVSGAAG